MPNHDDFISELAESILRGDLPRFGADELDAVLSWVSGSERLGAGELIRRLGTVRERPDLMRQVYAHLEAELFEDGRLDLQRAHVDDNVDEKARRARFRRLMTAFHPDRYPGDAEWMTPLAQAIHAAWRRFRRGESEADATETTPSPAPAQARKPRQKPGRNWRLERKSARLTPERTPTLTRLQRSLARTEHLQGKILTGLAVLAFVPVAWMYLASQPYRVAPPASEPVTVDVLDVAPAVTGPAEDQSIPESAPAVETPVIRIPEPTLEVEQAVGELPGQLAIWDSDWGRRARGDVVFELDLATTEPLALSLAEPEPFLPLEPAPLEPAPDTLRIESSAEPDLPEPDTPATAPVQDIVTSAVEPGPRESSPEVTPSPADEPEPEATESAPSEPQQTAPGPRPDAAAERETDTSVADTATPEVRITMIDPAPPEPDRPASRELIGELLDAYRVSFERGELENFMDNFTASPRENRNEGRDWFRDNYRWLFTESDRRRLELDILDIESAEDYWLVTASFKLQVDWPDRRPVRDRREVRYTVRDINDGRLRIAAIDY